MPRKLDWAMIQQEYDSGLTYAELKEQHGIHSQSFNNARKRGDFVSRSRTEAALLATSNGHIPPRYDWDLLQQEYDNGMSYRQLQAKYGISQHGLNKARKCGRLKTRTVSEALVLKVTQGWTRPPNVMGAEARTALSERQTLHNSGGKCKWFDVGDQRVQGTWERDAGLKLTELGIEWRKCAGRDDIIRYVLDGKERRYTPDFYLPAYDVYLEFKGYWWGDDRRKMDAVLARTDRNIAILEKDRYYELINDGKLRL
jgi:hypothetical protein